MHRLEPQLNRIQHVSNTPVIGSDVTQNVTRRVTGMRGLRNYIRLSCHVGFNCGLSCFCVITDFYAPSLYFRRSETSSGDLTRVGYACDINLHDRYGVERRRPSYSGLFTAQIYWERLTSSRTVKQCDPIGQAIE